MFRIELAFGHRRRDGVTLGTDEVAEAEQLALTFFCQVIGGGQVYFCNRIGGYPDTEGQAEREACTVVWAFYPNRRYTLNPIAALLGKYSCPNALSRLCDAGS